jgi:hypothetical protein
VNAVDLLNEKLTPRERWGRGPTDEERIALAAAILTRRCDKCGARKTGTFVETGAWWADHAKAGCR